MIYIIHVEMELWDFMLEGIKNRKDVKEFSLDRYTNIFHHICRNYLRNIILPKCFLLGRTLRLELKKLHDGDSVIISAYTSPNLYHAIKKAVSDKVSVNLWMWNPIKSNPIFESSIGKLREMGISLHTFDKKDASNYGMEFHNSFYRMNVAKENVNNVSDFYFLGAQKNRGTEINEIINLLKPFRSLFITPLEQGDFISYKDNLRHIQETKCIVEILQKNQHDMTLRPLEALAFKKKLLTNNSNIEQYSFYNSNNIFILGKDDPSMLKEFIEKPYIDIDQDIIKQFDINTWINSFIN